MKVLQIGKYPDLLGEIRLLTWAYKKSPILDLKMTREEILKLVVLIAG